MASRRVEVVSVFDRLGKPHLAQAYRILVPELKRTRQGSFEHGHSSDLRKSLVGETEGIADDFESDSSRQGVRRVLGS